jgi:hypothetical protein
MPMNPAVGNGRPRKKKRRKQDGPATGAKEIARRERAIEIMDLRKAGWSLEKIGLMQKPKISRERVRAIIDHWLTVTTVGAVESIRNLELERLDELQTGFWDKALNGDPFAVDKVLAIMAKRAQLLGLNAPEKTQVEEVGKLAEAKTQVEDAKAELIAKLNVAAQRLRIAQDSPPAIEHEAIEATPVEIKTVN